jgi:hypothetical protein
MRLPPHAEQHALQAPPAERGTSRFPHKKLLHMPGSVTTLGRPGAREWRARAYGFGTVSAPGMIGLSRFNGWPVHSPADASPAPLRASAHGSEPMRIATP